MFDGGDGRRIARPGPPSATDSWVATIDRSVYARVAPSSSARVRTLVSATAPLGGGQTRLLVRRSVERQGERWLDVALPIRPNGSHGWIPEHATSTAQTPYRITVNLTTRRLTLFRSGRPIMKVPVAVGQPSTPTPTGSFAVAEEIRTRIPGNFIGPMVLPLTGFSRVLNEFAGGHGRVAIHGTSVPHLIGTRASHGCIRLRNRDVVRLARIITPGTPVRIHP